MKSFFKRSAISLVVLGMAGSSYAAMSHHASSNNNAMWSPRLTGVFLGAEGLDLRGQNGDLDYLTIVPTTTDGAFNTKAVSTSYDWNWRVYGGIKFTDSDDVTLSWLHLNNSNHKSTGFIGGTTYVPRWLSGATVWDGGITGKVNFDVDEAYGVWGHTVTFNNPWSLRFAAGVEYAEVDSDMTVTGSTLGSDIVLSNKADSHLSGWGPRLELDATYHFTNELSWFLRTNAALLSSTRKVSLHAQDNDPIIAPNVYSSSYSTRNVVIPKLGMKVGAAYSYLFGQAGAEGACGTTLTVEAGWQVDTYIHAIERPGDGFYSATTVPVVPVNVASTKTSNFTDEGFFVGVKVSSDWL